MLLMTESLIVRTEIVLALEKATQPTRVACSSWTSQMGLALLLDHGLIEVDDLQICQSSIFNFLQGFDIEA